MAEVARLMGIERREYTGSDGQARVFCGLHLCHVEGSSPEVNGSKCENVSCPREVDQKKLKLGALYELGYTIYQTKNGKGARLAELIPVEE